MAEITGLLLAAGASTRFGTNKLTALLKGRALVLHSADALSPCGRIIAVVRDSDAEVQDLLRSVGAKIVINPDADRGMGSSIACGVSASRDSDGWCIIPADMPRVLPATTLRIVNALNSGAALVAPYYQHRRGHPVGFNKDFLSALIELDGDTGARTIVERYQDRLVALVTDDPGVLLDADIEQDLSMLEAGR